MAHFLSTVACVPLLSMSITALATTAPVFNSGSHAVLARRIGSGKGKGKAKKQTKKGDGEDFLSFAEGENKEKEAKKKRAQKAKKKKTPSLSMQSNAAVASEVAAFHRATWEREAREAAWLHPKDLPEDEGHATQTVAASFDASEGDSFDLVEHHGTSLVHFSPKLTLLFKGPFFQSKRTV